MTAKGTNETEFRRFIELLIPQRKRLRYVKPILVMDGHPAHSCLSLRNTLSRNFEVMKMPASSCEFNSIESLWSLIKSIYYRKIVQETGRIRSQDQFREFVFKVADELSEDKIRPFFTANNTYLSKMTTRDNEQ